MLTQKQYDLLVYIDHYIVSHGIAPSFDEMKEALSLKSKSGIHVLISALEERGFIIRLSNRARAIEVIKLPRNTPKHQILGNNRKFTALQGNLPPAIVHIPLRGYIAAGLPREAIESYDTDIEVPSALLGKGEYYALEVEGDSMVGKGIYEGDTVIIKSSNTASQGDIVVALIDDEEAMLKIFCYEKPYIILESANSNYPPRSYTMERVRLQGQLCGLIRKY